jgi:outer membrane protein insertion porin family
MDRVRGAVFNDVGFLDPDAFTYGRVFKSNPYPNATGEITAAAGVGLRLDLPIGPLRLDYALPYVDQGYNHTTWGRFDFDVGYQF